MGGNVSFRRHFLPAPSNGSRAINYYCAIIFFGGKTIWNVFLVSYLFRFFFSLKLDSLNVNFIGAEHTVTLNPGEK